MTKLVRLDAIASNAECLAGVDLMMVAHYRALLREGSKPPPILLWGKNREKFYVISDGNHRVLAALLEGCTHIEADIVKGVVALSWRWPRVAPVTDVRLDLVRREIRRDRRKRSA